MRTQISLPAVLACLILVLGALVLVFWPVAKSGWSQMMSITGPNAVGSAAARPLGETALVQVDGTDPTRPDDEEKLTKASSSSISVGPEIVPLIPALPTAMPSLVSDGLVKPLAAAYTTLVPLTGAVVSASDILVFRAKGNSWVEVTDSKGQVVLRRTLNAGETASASGALPLAAVVGRADSTQVQVRGKAFDLSGYAKDNVARFEVR